MTARQLEDLIYKWGNVVERVRIRRLERRGRRLEKRLRRALKRSLRRVSESVPRVPASQEEER